MRILRTVFEILFWVIIAFFGLLVIEYLFAPVYDFPSPERFSGSKIFNPYRNIDTNDWRKANFQVQSRVWGGITDGRKNTNEYIDSIYRYLEYDITGISDYMQINRHGEDKPSYIPIYEHGYSVSKHHHVLIGADKVTWRDYAFYQSLSHKQHMIDKLRDHTKFLLVVHPSFHNAFAPNDFRYLSGYDGIEILNYFRISLPHWDSALSSGHYVTGIGDDDVHDITNPDEVGQYCTFINSPGTDANSIITAMKSGKNFAAHIYRSVGETFDKRKEKLSEIARPDFVRVNNDTLFVKVDQRAKQFRFIGQSGDVKKTVDGTDQAFYVIQPSDTYVRTEIDFWNGNQFFLNPVARFETTWPPITEKATVNIYKTWVYRILLAASIIFVLTNLIVIRNKILKRKGK